jgi:hypothetical protein
MPATTTAPPTHTVEQPKHPLHAMTTFELRDYRRDLERAIAGFTTGRPGVPGPCRPASQAR